MHQTIITRYAPDEIHQTPRFMDHNTLIVLTFVHQNSWTCLLFRWSKDFNINTIYEEYLMYLAMGLGMEGGTTGVATAFATGRFRAFRTAPGFFNGRSAELESESESE